MDCFICCSYLICDRETRIIVGEMGDGVYTQAFRNISIVMGCVEL